MRPGQMLAHFHRLQRRSGQWVRLLVVLRPISCVGRAAEADAAPSARQANDWVQPPITDDEHTERMLVTEALEELGYEAIKRAEVAAGLKALFITGYADNAMLSQGRFDSGMQFLAKLFAIGGPGNRIKHLIVDQ